MMSEEEEFENELGYEKDTAEAVDFVIKPKFAFEPLEDMTASELSRLFRVCGMIVSSDIYEKMDADLQRHFKELT